MNFSFRFDIWFLDDDLIYVRLLGYLIENVRIIIMDYFQDYELWDMRFYSRLIYWNENGYDLWYAIPLHTIEKERAKNL